MIFPDEGGVSDDWEALEVAQEGLQFAKTGSCFDGRSLDDQAYFVGIAARLARQMIERRSASAETIAPVRGLLG